MEIICSELYEKQLKEILEPLAKENLSFAKKFKMYLDTIIINIPTKVDKYKKSIYFDDENIKDLEYENYTVVFYVEKSNNKYIILGIVKKS